MHKESYQLLTSFLQLIPTLQKSSYLLNLPDHLCIRLMSESSQRQIHHPLPKTTSAHPPHTSQIPKTALAVSKILYALKFQKSQHIIEKTKKVPWKSHPNVKTSAKHLCHATLPPSILVFALV